MNGHFSNECHAIASFHLNILIGEFAFFSIQSYIWKIAGKLNYLILNIYLMIHKFNTCDCGGVINSWGCMVSCNYLDLVSSYKDEVENNIMEANRQLGHDIGRLEQLCRLELKQNHRNVI